MLRFGHLRDHISWFVFQLSFWCNYSWKKIPNGYISLEKWNWYVNIKRNYHKKLWLFACSISNWNSYHHVNFCFHMHSKKCLPSEILDEVKHIRKWDQVLELYAIKDKDLDFSYFTLWIKIYFCFLNIYLQWPL